MNPRIKAQNEDQGNPLPIYSRHIIRKFYGLTFLNSKTYETFNDYKNFPLPLHAVYHFFFSFVYKFVWKIRKRSEVGLGGEIHIVYKS